MSQPRSSPCPAVIAGETRVLETGDVMAVPRGEVHRAEVVGLEEVVSLDATRA